jgi:acid-sensing ion channel, other
MQNTLQITNSNKTKTKSQTFLPVSRSRYNKLIFNFILEIPGIEFCGIKDRICYQTVGHQNAADNVNEIQSSSCHCLSTCTSISYDAEISNLRHLGNLGYFENLKKKTNKTKKLFFSRTSIDIGFRENQFVTLKRSQLFGKTELLANCGGLLGLFLGLSIISIVEVIYFFTIRLVTDIKTNF